MYKFLRKASLLLVAVFVFAAVSFAQSGGLKGKVRTGSGKGIPKAEISVRKDGKDVKSTKTDEKGNFTLQGLSSGKYNVTFDANGYSTGVLYNIQIESGKTRDLGDRLILAVDQGTLVILKGSVFFKEGTSVTGAKVEVFEVRADGTTKSLGTGFTNVSGEFTFKTEPKAAKLRLTAKYKGVSASKDIDVENAAIYRTALSLDISRTEK